MIFFFQTALIHTIIKLFLTVIRICNKRAGNNMIGGGTITAKYDILNADKSGKNLSTLML